MPPTRRIVAGVSGSPGNLPALRHAADLARVYDAALTFVHAWLPSGPCARSGLNDRWPAVRGPGSNTVVDHGRMPWQNCDLAWSASRYA